MVLLLNNAINRFLKYFLRLLVCTASVLCSLQNRDIFASGLIVLLWTSQNNSVDLYQFDYHDELVLGPCIYPIYVRK